MMGKIQKDIDIIQTFTNNGNSIGYIQFFTPEGLPDFTEEEKRHCPQIGSIYRDIDNALVCNLVRSVFLYSPNKIIPVMATGVSFDIETNQRFMSLYHNRYTFDSSRLNFMDLKFKVEITEHNEKIEYKKIAELDYQGVNTETFNEETLKDSVKIDFEPIEIKNGIEFSIEGLPEYVSGYEHGLTDMEEPYFPYFTKEDVMTSSFLESIFEIKNLKFYGKLI